MAILDSKSVKTVPAKAHNKVAKKRAANVVAVNQPPKKRLTKKEKKLQKS